jgi:hypothetical protein
MLIKLTVSFLFQCDVVIVTEFPDLLLQTIIIGYKFVVDFVSYSYLIIIGLLTSFMDVFVH